MQCCFRKDNINPMKAYGGCRGRGELIYLAPLGSENISAPYFKQCFFRGGGGITPPDWVKHHASQSQDRNNKFFYFIYWILHQ